MSRVPLTASIMGRCSRRGPEAPENNTGRGPLYNEDAMRFPRGRPPRLLAVALVAMLLFPAGSPVVARDAKSVFSGLPIDPETLKPPVAERPIRFEPAWRFEGFSAPLAGELAVSQTILAGVDVAGRLIA